MLGLDEPEQSGPDPAPEGCWVHCESIDPHDGSVETVTNETDHPLVRECSSEDEVEPLNVMNRLRQIRDSGELDELSLHCVRPTLDADDFACNRRIPMIDRSDLHGLSLHRDRPICRDSCAHSRGGGLFLKRLWKGHAIRPFDCSVIPPLPHGSMWSAWLRGDCSSQNSW